LKPVKVLIADDHPLIRQGLVRVLSLDPVIEVIGEAVNGEDAIAKTERFRPDIILMDLYMPEMDGFEAAKIIRENYPDTKIIALTVEDSEQRVLEGIKAGVQGYILKDVEPDALASTIKAVYAGEMVIHPKITSMLFRELEQTAGCQGDSHARGNEKVRLTPREVEILECIARGIHNKEIASRLFISEKTVKNHITNIFKKLQVEDRTQAALSAIKMKLVNL